MTGYEALHTSAGLVERGAGSVLVRGPQAREFLQNLVSQDLTGLGDGDGAHSLLLQPTGKLDVELRVLVVDAAAGVGDGTSDGVEFWLDTEPGWGERLAESLRRYLIRTDAEVVERSAEWARVSLRGPEALAIVHSVARVEVPRAAHHHVAWGDVRLVRADWPGTRGVDVVGPAGPVADAVPLLVGPAGVIGRATPASDADWETFRVECGVPRLGADLDEGVIPQEAFLDRVAVSFDKGCFLGQELVCRIKDRGRVNRHLRRLRVAQGELPPVGADLVAAEKKVGSITSAAESPALGAVVALGYVRAEIPVGSEVVARWDDSEATAVVEEVVPAG